MRIYVCGRYSRRLELLAYAEELEAAGHRITSRWVTGYHETPGWEERTEISREGSVRNGEISRWAEADIILVFSEFPGVNGRSRGGRHVEFGLAIAWEKRVVIVGPRENVFMHLGGVECYPTWEEAKAAL